MSFFRNRSSRLVRVFFFLALLLVLRGTVFLGHAWRNAGLLVLSRALSESPSGSTTLLVAKTFLRRAIDLSSGDDLSAWRGLGFVFEIQGRERESKAAWHKGGFSAQDFIIAGKESVLFETDIDALKWYGRAIIMEPHSGDPWFYIGLMHEEKHRWEKALNAYQKALEMNSLNLAGFSSPWCRIAMIYHLHLEPARIEDALGAYKTAIGENDFEKLSEVSAQHRTADCHYEYGALIRQLKSQDTVERYVQQFEKALEVYPQHYRARVLLGVAYYERDGDLEAAEREINLAIQQSSENKRAYFMLGSIYRREGMINQAIKVYNRILEIDPDDRKAQQYLQDLHAQKGTE